MTDKEDNNLFQSEMAGVKPLSASRTSSRARVSRAPSTPSEAQLARRQSATQEFGQDENLLTTEYVEMVDPHDVLEFKRGGVQEGVYRKLRLGKYAIESRLDLHRLSVEQAREQVFDFVRECGRAGLRTVMILHGKGERSETPALLKSYVNKWLPQLPEVMAFHSAQRQDGGAGAMYVLLKKSEERKQANRERFMRGR